MRGLPNSKLYGEILISNQMGKTPCFNKVHHLVKVASRCYYYHIIYFVLSVDICHHSTYCVCHLKKKKCGRENSAGTSKSIWLSCFTLPPPKKKPQRRPCMLQRSSLEDGFSVTKTWPVRFCSSRASDKVTCESASVCSGDSTSRQAHSDCPRKQGKFFIFVMAHKHPFATPQVHSHIRLTSLECTGVKSLPFQQATQS